MRRVRAYRDPSAGVMVVDSQTKEPVPRKGGLVVLHTCRVGHDKERDLLYVEGVQADPGTYRVQADRLAVLRNGQWQLLGLTPALVSKESKQFFRLPPGETDRSRARPLHVCEWSVLATYGGLQVSSI